jgi:hypothetical protein
MGGQGGVCGDIEGLADSYVQVRHPGDALRGYKIERGDGQGG